MLCFESVAAKTDCAGDDTYPAEFAFAGNYRMWTRAGANTDDPLPLVELGVGVDGEVVRE